VSGLKGHRRGLFNVYVWSVDMAADDYARAAELLARSKVERDPEVAELLETVAGGFQQLADTPTLPIQLNFAPNGKVLLRR
jgi:hypothetical protein